MFKCLYCDKISYLTESDAKDSARFLALKNHERMYSYECPKGRGWHLTSTQTQTTADMNGKASKNKGDRFERSCAEYLTNNTKFTVRRRFGAGANEDRGDLEGLPGITIQAADWANKTDALRIKPPQADIQAARTHESMIGVTAIKLRGGEMRFVFTQEAFCKLINKLTP